MSTQLVPYEQQEKLAIAIAKSGLFGMKTPDQAIALMALCEAEGLHPAIAVRDYHIIQGRPVLKADAMMARFQQAGGRVEWHDYTDKAVSATFSHPQGGTVKIDWTMDRAKQADLGGKDNWKKYPRQMLRTRVISEGIRTVYPGCVVGIYTPEEVDDFDEPKSPRNGKSHQQESRTAPVETTAEVVPEPDIKPESFEDIISKIDDAVLLDYLRSVGWLSPVELVGDLSQEHRDKIVTNKKRFLSSVEKFIEKAA